MRIEFNEQHLALVERLQRAVHQEHDDERITRCVAAMILTYLHLLPEKHSAAFERILTSLVLAAEELGLDADVEVISCRAREIAAQPH